MLLSTNIVQKIWKPSRKHGRARLLPSRILANTPAGLGSAGASPYRFSGTQLTVILFCIIAVICLTALGPQAAWGQSAWHEGHEGTDTSWREAGGNANYKIELHKRAGDQAHTGNGCEHIRVSGQGGTYVYFSHVVDCPLVIPELLPTVWVKSDRAGLQIMARLVLPRTEDPRTGSPITTLVRGTSYTRVGRWQQLQINQIPLLLNRAIRVLRMQMGPKVDGREAFVDRVLINVYGGPGKTNVWIDDLDIAGHVKRPPKNPKRTT